MTRQHAQGNHDMPHPPREERIRRVEACQHGMGRPPYGYSVQKGRLEVNEETAKVVRLVFEMLDGGVSLLAVCEALNKAGIPGPGGKRWGHTAVLRIRNRRPFYEGRCCVVDGDLYVPSVTARTHWPILKQEG